MKENIFIRGEDPDRSMITDRSLRKYVRLLDLNIEDLRGKTILDLGSGLYQRFGRQLKEIFPQSHTQVVCLDISLRDEKRRKAVREIEEKGLEFPGYDEYNVPKLKDKEKPALVAGLFTKLPFANNSFDIVLSLFGTPTCLSTMEATKKSIEEIWRILKPGGEARLMPSTFLAEKALNDLGIKYELKFPSTPEYRWITETINYLLKRFPKFQRFLPLKPRLLIFHKPSVEKVQK